MAAHGDRIVQAIAVRSDQDSGMSIDQVQQLLVLRVREEAEQLGVRPRALMGAVWRAWERHNRPPLLGQTETRRVLDRLIERGLLTIEEHQGKEPIVLWCGLEGEALQEKLASLEPALDHEEELFLEGIRRHLQARAAGAWFSWDVQKDEQT